MVFTIFPWFPHGFPIGFPKLQRDHWACRVGPRQRVQWPRHARQFVFAAGAVERHIEGTEGSFLRIFGTYGWLIFEHMADSSSKNHLKSKIRWYIMIYIYIYIIYIYILKIIYKQMKHMIHMIHMCIYIWMIYSKNPLPVLYFLCWKIWLTINGVRSWWCLLILEGIPTTV